MSLVALDWLSRVSIPREWGCSLDRVTQPAVDSPFVHFSIDLSIASVSVISLSSLIGQGVSVQLDSNIHHDRRSGERRVGGLGIRLRLPLANSEWMNPAQPGIRHLVGAMGERGRSAKVSTRLWMILMTLLTRSAELQKECRTERSLRGMLSPEAKGRASTRAALCHGGR